MTSLREDRSSLLGQFLELVVDLLKAFLHGNSFYLVFMAFEIQMKFTKISSEESSELERSFDSDDSEINFIAV